jgi:predicted nucleic acid-binding protein
VTSNLFLDTSILVHFLRESPIFHAVDKQLGLFAKGKMPFISEVTVGEIFSLSIQMKWGAKRLSEMKKVLSLLKPIPISHDEIMQRYALLDAFSKNRHPELPLPNSTTARKMGKNDLWIAATASVLEATLLTTDNDFDHLSPRFFLVENVGKWQV